MCCVCVFARFALRTSAPDGVVGHILYSPQAFEGSNKKRKVDSYYALTSLSLTRVELLVMKNAVRMRIL